MSDPNSWSPIQVKNEWGGTITNVQVHHRYDDDHYDKHTWPSLTNNETGSGMQAGYWTGFGRTGKDYWQVTFDADGGVYTNKNNFYCYLTSDDSDSGGAVILTIQSVGGLNLHVAPPKSGSCNVSLDKVG
ncbi:MAG: hypothetical protein ACFB2W_00015 [Leptolyngbyaceae cyanobacterium]